jgi:uncharacterized repeat protein (TIGR01451 family)
MVAAAAALAGLLALVMLRVTLASPVHAVAAACPVPVTGASLSGPTSARTGFNQVYTVLAAPLGVSTPITYLWTPTPDSGQGTPTAVYRWSDAGHKLVTVRVSNCGGEVAAQRRVTVYTRSEPDLRVQATAPPFAFVVEQVIYTLTITNSGATTATDVLVTNTVPTGAAYVEGGVLVANSVRWVVPAIGGIGASAQVTYAVNFAGKLVNDDYGASAGLIQATPGTPAVTYLVEDIVRLEPFAGGSLQSGVGPRRIEVLFQAESRTAPLTVGFARQPEPGHRVPLVYAAVDRNFRLVGDPSPAEDSGGASNLLRSPFSVTVGYDAELDDVELVLAYWDGRAWSTSGAECVRDPAARVIACRITAPRLTDFALFGPGPGPSRLLLPLVRR